MAVYADVIIDIDHERVDKPFTYRIPERLEGAVGPGTAVVVPFGKGDSRKTAYVIGLKDEPDMDPERIKEIAGIDETGTPATSVLIRLAWWMKHAYGSTMIAALKTVLPAGKRVRSLVRKKVYLRADREEATAMWREALARKGLQARARILEELLAHPDVGLPMEFITGKLMVSASVVKTLADKGVVRIESADTFRNPVSADGFRGKQVELSEEQGTIVDRIVSDHDEGIRKTYLLRGVTGSGKTEVYINCVRKMQERGLQSIVLIPEISLTWQTLMRFYTYFGDRVSVMNSTLSAGEKYDQFKRARDGEIDVIIGPRSALFTPFPRLGLIIIDEEHESSYKSENMPRYHAREAAIQLAKLVPGGASVLLGSATPSVGYAVKSGLYGGFTLDSRQTGSGLPRAVVADMRSELRAGNRSPFSRILRQKIAQRLEAGEQTMLFINRRGMAGFVSCRACGYVFRCPHCDVSLSQHREGRLICHYCGHEEPMPRICPECGSRYVKGFKAGTEAMELHAAKEFPGARILRMDADTTRTKGSYERILETFSNGDADILIGTQMIVKGHDFPGVTLVGILAADVSLNTGDYRAAERTWELLVQAAGRAGRRDKSGEVVIQTYQPEHYAIKLAVTQDAESFYEEEMGYRSLAGYPPAAHLLAVQIYDRDERGAADYAQKLRDLFDAELSGDRGVTVIGPAPAMIGRIADTYRFGVYLKSRDREALVRLKDAAESQMSADRDAGRNLKTFIQFDFDPMRGF